MSSCTWPMYHRTNISFLTRQEAVPMSHKTTFKLDSKFIPEHRTLQLKLRRGRYLIHYPQRDVWFNTRRKVNFSTWDYHSTRPMWNWHIENFSQKPLFCVKPDRTVRDNLVISSKQCNTPQASLKETPGKNWDLVGIRWFSCKLWRTPWQFGWRLWLLASGWMLVRSLWRSCVALLFKWFSLFRTNHTTFSKV